jgi:parallel beta-helix repeat protein
LKKAPIQPSKPAKNLAWESRLEEKPFMAEKFLRYTGGGLPANTADDDVLQKVASSDIVRLANGASNVGGIGNIETAGPRPWADVRAFGAVGDGSADDSPKFQDAIDTVAAAGGGLVLVPPGTYRLFSTVFLGGSGTTAPVALIGTDPSACILKFAQSVRFKAAHSNCVMANLTFNWAGEASYGAVFNTNTGAFSNWRFENCVFNNITLNCVTVAGFSQDISVIGCQFLDVLNNGFKAYGLTNLVIDGCLAARCGTVPYNGPDAIKVEACTNVRILNTTAHSNKRDGMDIFNSNRVTVANCNLIGNEMNGLEAKWNVSGEGELGDNPHNIIANNRAVGNGTFAQLGDDTEPHPYGNGLLVNVNRTIVVGNVCEDNVSNGIWINVPDLPSSGVPTEQTIIANNICRNNGNSDDPLEPSTDLVHGIYTGKAHKLVLSGNQCHNNKSYGIWSNVSSQKSIFANNICFTNGAGGLSPLGSGGIFSNGSGHVFKDNQTQDVEGVLLGSSASKNTINRYGQEKAGSGNQPTATDWRVGVIVKNTSDGTFWLRVPASTNWRQIP